MSETSQNSFEKVTRSLTTFFCIVWIVYIRNQEITHQCASWVEQSENWLVYWILAWIAMWITATQLTQVLIAKFTWKKDDTIW